MDNFPPNKNLAEDEVEYMISDEEDNVLRNKVLKKDKNDFRIYAIPEEEEEKGPEEQPVEEKQEEVPAANASVDESLPSSTLPEIPVNEESETTMSPAVEEANPNAASTSSTISGGRNHYVHSPNKKATTYRHHKRRNRHQTLRNYKK